MSDKEELGTWTAAWHALRGQSLHFFPRSGPQDPGRTLEDHEILKPSVGMLKDVADDDPNIDGAIRLAAASLKEVKDQTEYQDVKATRLLTIITFLGAFGSVLFARYFDSVQVSKLLENVQLDDLKTTIQRGEGFWSLTTVALALASYAVFAFFLICATLGALVTFHAARTRFRYDLKTLRDEARSFLFYKPITETDPSAWANAFLSEDRRSIAPNLRRRYLENYIGETALVAAKVADKVRYLAPAQQFLGRAIIALLIWMILAMATLVLATVVGVPP